jgi:plastocyanin
MMHRYLTNLFVGLAVASSLLATVVVAQESIVVDWIIPSDGETLADVTAFVGDTVQFDWSGTHNVYLHPSMSCDRTGSSVVATTSGSIYTLVEAGTYYFACHVGSHCDLGQHITVTVEARSGDGDADSDIDDEGDVDSPTAAPVGSDNGDRPTVSGGSSPTDGSTADTCTIDGQIFQRGDNLGEAFVTVCGSPDLFPCFCNPDIDGQAECPYCGFETTGNGYRCAKGGETITFIDVAGVGQSCGCVVPDSPASPICTCTEDSDAQVCDITLSDGEKVKILPGERVGSDPVCGRNFPCFCDPSRPSKQVSLFTFNSEDLD